MEKRDQLPTEMLSKRGMLRCPKCDYPFPLNEQQDRLHPFASTEKPRKADVDGDVKEELYDCPNEKCRNPITVYWFMPKRRFLKI
ncbi:MAG TPA: hypothetical protein VK487_07115 [Candidatus Bathyarchaeia archaeon]|nr:hypothetical protein [Candidatus Bathyarchaeia archaeon]